MEEPEEGAGPRPPRQARMSPAKRRSSTCNAPSQSPTNVTSPFKTNVAMLTETTPVSTDNEITTLKELMDTIKGLISVTMMAPVLPKKIPKAVSLPGQDQKVIDSTNGKEDNELSTTTRKPARVQSKKKRITVDLPNKENLSPGCAVEPTTLSVEPESAHGQFKSQGHFCTKEQPNQKKKRGLTSMTNGTNTKITSVDLQKESLLDMLWAILGRDSVCSALVQSMETRPNLRHNAVSVCVAKVEAILERCVEYIMKSPEAKMLYEIFFGCLAILQTDLPPDLSDDLTQSAIHYKAPVSDVLNQHPRLEIFSPMDLSPNRSDDLTQSAIQNKAPVSDVLNQPPRLEIFSPMDLSPNRSNDLTQSAIQNNAAVCDTLDQPPGLDLNLVQIGSKKQKPLLTSVLSPPFLRTITRSCKEAPVPPVKNRTKSAPSHNPEQVSRYPRRRVPRKSYREVRRKSTSCPTLKCVSPYPGRSVPSKSYREIRRKSTSCPTLECVSPCPGRSVPRKSYHEIRRKSTSCPTLECVSPCPRRSVPRKSYREVRRKSTSCPTCVSPCPRRSAPRKIYREVRRKSTSCPTLECVSPYPRRSVSRKSYHEADVPQDDDFIFCDECDREYEGDCPTHGALHHIPDTQVPDHVSGEERAIRTSPKQLAVGKSSIPGAGKGVWTKEIIRKRTQFGPFVGTCISPKAKSTGYSWELMKDRKVVACIDSSDPEKSNWMRYINCATQKAEQNLFPFQYKSAMYYRVLSDLEPDEELLVWYGDRYGKELGIDVDSYHRDEPTAEQNPACRCPACSLSCRSPANHRIKLCRKQKGPFVSNPNRKNSTTGADNTVNHKGKRSVCRQASASKSLPTTHIDSIDRPFGCTLCEARFTQKGNLVKHQKIHQGEKYICGICQATFNRRDNLQRHELIHARAKPKQAASSATYRHLVVQSARKKAQPGKKMSQLDIKSSRKKANTDKKTSCKKANADKKTYSCGVCNIGFTCSRNLIRHGNKLHSNRNPLSCDICQAKFSHRFILNRHKKEHAGGKPYPCGICGNAFAKSSRLKTHLRCHTGEKPFACDLCGDAFAQRSHLTIHSRRHTGEKPFACVICGNAFAQSSHLKTHCRRHTGEKPYVCDFCGVAFAQSSHLTYHSRRYHPTGDKLLA